jgi:hypothetical protein
MREFCADTQLLVISLIMLISTSILFSQTKGTWSLGYSVGIFTKGGLSLDYFVHDNLSIEVFLGGIPHISNRGFGVNVFPYGQTRVCEQETRESHQRCPRHEHFGLF